MRGAGRSSEGPYRTPPAFDGALAPSLRWVGYVGGALHAASGALTALVLHALLTDRTCGGMPSPQVASALTLLALSAGAVATGVWLQRRLVLRVKRRWRVLSRSRQIAWQLAALGPAIASFALCAVLAASLFPLRICVHVTVPVLHTC